MDTDLTLRFIQCHQIIKLFDYGIAVDWAVDQVSKGNESANVLMLAAFSNPTDRLEVKPYVTAVLRELDLEDPGIEQAVLAIGHFHADKISRGNNPRYHTNELAQFYLQFEYHKLLAEFREIADIRDDFDDYGFSYTDREVTPDNIETYAIAEAQKWIDCFILGKEAAEPAEHNTPDQSSSRKQPWWKRLLS